MPRKLTRYAVAALPLIALAALWRPFAARIGAILDVATAGIAFAMQEVIRALTGWVNMLSGRISPPLRRKVLEIGGGGENDPRGCGAGSTPRRSWRS